MVDLVRRTWHYASLQQHPRYIIAMLVLVCFVGGLYHFVL